MRFCLGSNMSPLNPAILSDQFIYEYYFDVFIIRSLARIRSITVSYICSDMVEWTMRASRACHSISIFFNKTKNELSTRGLVSVGGIAGKPEWAKLFLKMSESGKISFVGGAKNY